MYKLPKNFDSLSFEDKNIVLRLYTKTKSGSNVAEQTKRDLDQLLKSEYQTLDYKIVY